MRHVNHPSHTHASGFFKSAPSGGHWGHSLRRLGSLCRRHLMRTYSNVTCNLAALCCRVTNDPRSLFQSFIKLTLSQCYISTATTEGFNLTCSSIYSLEFFFLSSSPMSFISGSLAFTRGAFKLIDHSVYTGQYERETLKWGDHSLYTGPIWKCVMI